MYQHNKIANLISKLNLYKLIPYPVDTHDQPRYQLTRGLIGLDNEKDDMTSSCLDRKEVRGAIWGVHSTGTGQLVRALCTRIR